MAATSFTISQAAENRASALWACQNSISNSRPACDNGTSRAMRNLGFPMTVLYWNLDHQSTPIYPADSAYFALAAGAEPDLPAKARIRATSPLKSSVTTSVSSSRPQT